MFKFNFEVEEEDEDQVHIPGTGTVTGSQRISDTSANVPASVTPPAAAGSSQSQSKTPAEQQKCHHLSLDELIDTLPETISYSPIHLPFLAHPLLRRDLYDARFQLAATTTTTTAAGPSAGASALPRIASTSGPHAGAPDAADTVKDGSALGGQGEEFVDAKTDLIPGHYEGGLKTWEGGVDLVEVLTGVRGGVAEWVRGSKVLEVGCGTAIPSAYILRSVLSSPSAQLSSAHSHPDINSPPGSTDSAHPANTHSESPHTRTPHTILHLQDFNLPVLSLVTLPNLLLASLPFFPPEAFHNPDEADDVESILPDLDVAGEIYVSDRVKGAWRELLVQRGVTLRFTYGHWGGLARELLGDKVPLRYGREADEGETKRQGEGGIGGIGGTGGLGGYGLVMTAETIYAEDSVNDLIGVLRNAAAVRPGGDVAGRTRKPKREEVALEDSLGDMSVGDEWATTPLRDAEPVILVAAKVLYFGVGGGLQSFLDRVSAEGAWWSGVKEWTMGVGRKVVRIGW